MKAEIKKIITVEMNETEAFTLKELMIINLNELSFDGREIYAKCAKVLGEKISDIGI